MAVVLPLPRCRSTSQLTYYHLLTSLYHSYLPSQLSTPVMSRRLRPSRVKEVLRFSRVGSTKPNPISHLSHPALHSPDILEEIFEHIDPWNDQSQGRLTCVSAALVCRSFSEPASRALWRGMDTLSPLWSIISKDKPLIRVPRRNESILEMVRLVNVILLSK